MEIASFFSGSIFSKSAHSALRFAIFKAGIAARTLTLMQDSEEKQWNITAQIELKREICRMRVVAMTSQSRRY